MGELLSIVYREAIVKSKTSLNEVRTSTECLIDLIEVDKIPVKLFCAYKATVESIETIKKELEAKGINVPTDRPINPVDAQKVSIAQTDASPALPAEGAHVDSTADDQWNAPVYEADKAMDTFESKTDETSTETTETKEETDPVVNSEVPTVEELIN